jgi:hypothetical protein
MNLSQGAKNKIIKTIIASKKYFQIISDEETIDSFIITVDSNDNANNLKWFLFGACDGHIITVEENAVKISKLPTINMNG